MAARGRSAFGGVSLFLGRLFISVGLVLFGFVGFELYGTSFIASSSQSDLADQFEDVVSAPAPAPAPADPAAPAPVPEVTAVVGEPVARVDVPAIGLSQVVVEGVARDQLSVGPGHYPGTPFPGQLGNVAIAGHRTTYGGPFGDLDKLVPGDEITVETVQGTFTYSVREAQIVLPSDVEVIAPTDTAQLTLTTCHPRFSAAQRLVVFADLVADAPLAATPSPVVEPPAGTDASASPSDTEVVGAAGDPTKRTSAALWAAVVALLVIAAFTVTGVLRRAEVGSKVVRAVVVWAPTLVFLVLPLWFLYTNLAAALPG